ncbi:MAG: MATE family efflux transporter [Faecalibacterium sp.]
MQHSLTQGPITKNILLFALPLMFGNLLQQMYNIADTWVVGRFLGADALAAVGSSYTLMTFLTSILLGLCMGSGAAVSMQYGSGETEKMRQSVFQSFLLIAGIALVLNLLVYLGLNGILWLLRVPAELCSLMKDYLLIIFLGIAATFLYNYFANLLRAIGNSVVPLAFLAVSAILNVILDLVCVLVLDWGVKGAAVAQKNYLCHSLRIPPQVFIIRYTALFFSVSTVRFSRISTLFSITFQQNGVVMVYQTVLYQPDIFRSYRSDDPGKSTNFAICSAAWS